MNIKDKGYTNTISEKDTRGVNIARSIMDSHDILAEYENQLDQMDFNLRDGNKSLSMSSDKWNNHKINPDFENINKQSL